MDPTTKKAEKKDVFNISSKTDEDTFTLDDPTPPTEAIDDLISRQSKLLDEQ